jgi:unsaturated chondroitin disaccharide hydrolase
MNPELDSIRPNLTRAVQFYAHQMQRLLEAHPDAFPVYTRAGRWVVDPDARTTGYEGYLPGQLWLLYRMTRNPWFHDMAERYTRALEPLKTDRYAPHLGQVFLPSWKRWFDFSGEPVLNQVVLDTGRTLAKRFVPESGYLHNPANPAILSIESLLDVPLLFYVAQKTEDPHLLHIARSHVETVRRYLVRGDGSTAEEALFEVDGGQFLRELHRQGWRSDSCWARGLAIAIYGFISVFSYTHSSQDLVTAENCARYYLEHTPSHGVPPQDFDQPEPSMRFDASAAALAAGGFWRLSAVVPDPNRAWLYRQYALRILETLTSADFLAYQDPEWEGVLKHAASHGESTMLADYYLLETIWEVFKTDR